MINVITDNLLVPTISVWLEEGEQLTSPTARSPSWTQVGITEYMGQSSIPYQIAFIFFEVVLLYRSGCFLNKGNPALTATYVLCARSPSRTQVDIIWGEIWGHWEIRGRSRLSTEEWAQHAEEWTHLTINLDSSRQIAARERGACGYWEC